MRVIVKLELSDEQRDNIDNKLSGKIRKRLATGNEIRDLTASLVERYASGEVFDTEERESNGEGLCKCPRCDKIHSTKDGQEHICACGCEFVAKKRGNAP